MGYRLAMSAEIRDWLTDLTRSDPASARLAGAALTALLGEDPGLGPPAVSQLEDRPRYRYEILAAALERSRQRKLEQVAAARGQAGEAADLVSDIEHQVDELVSLQAGLGDQYLRAVESARQDLADELAGNLAAAAGHLADLRQRLPGVIRASQRLAGRAQRLQGEVDAFRARTEILKARYVAAEGMRAAEEAIAAAGRAAGDPGQADGDGDAPAGHAGPAAAAARLHELASDIENELRGDPEAADLGDLRPAPGLMELRPALYGDLRILFAVQPAGITLLIAVLEGRDAVLEHYDEAVMLSSDVLRRARAGQAPEASAHVVAGAEAFLAEFFPGDAAGIRTGAAALIARNQARTLAQQRNSLGLSRAQVAERMGVRSARVAAIESAEPGATEVRTLAAFVQALGGQLEIVADFGGQRVLLR